MADSEAFVELRPLLFAVAYRMLGSATEAEDVLQEAYLRWADVAEASSPRAYLTTVVVRLCVDHLRSARVRRESYVGTWLPEPVLLDPEPDAVAVLADSVSLAFLVLLEELTPVERGAFLLREVFGYEYGEIAAMLDRTEPSCRQLVSRAKRHVAERRTRFDADREQSRELTRQFLAACATGDLDGLMSLLARDVVVYTDGGGKAQAALRPVHGADKAGRLLIGISKKAVGFTVREVVLNGQPGVVLVVDSVVTTALVIDVVGSQVSAVRIIANPDKLTAVRLALSEQ
ncbi:MAG: RNA polymerase sigma-70 factor [Actinomycetota bacterium]|nr:RNA polymerase sigma-70 factor [Actinomycetota bacterium]